MQVLNLTQEQLNTLPPKEWDQVLQLVSFFDFGSVGILTERAVQRRQFGLEN